MVRILIDLITFSNFFDSRLEYARICQILQALSFLLMQAFLESKCELRPDSLSACLNCLKRIQIKFWSNMILRKLASNSDQVSGSDGFISICLYSKKFKAEVHAEFLFVRLNFSNPGQILAVFYILSYFPFFHVFHPRSQSFLTLYIHVHNL